MDVPDVSHLIKHAKDIVTSAARKGQLSTLTQRIVRQELEKQLSLEAGALDAPQYKKTLKSAITEAVEEANSRRKPSSSVNSAPPSREPRGGRTSNKEPSTKTRDEKAASGKKETSPRQFKSTEYVATSDAEPEIKHGNSSPKQEAKAKNKKRAISSDSEAGERSKGIKGEKSQAKSGAGQPERSDSELSVLIDEPPKKKRSSKSQPKTTSRKSSGGKKAPEALSKDEDTIKRLKSLVVACGVRKVWSKVFEGVDKPSQQIRKLKEILSDLGMTGRFSLEQARAIREKRELAQELGG
ncbi:hypothetical protein AX17_005925 [Amanita inopinata Kibby_2008]|nr:hypothetical protein AX17_005925 [Amanita inopinata Kibby_2008]